MIVITGATGKLGHHVVEQLLKKVPAKQVAVAVRNPAKAKEYAALGVEVRQADYDQPQTLEAAFKGADKLLMISASEVGKRVPQHKAVIDAAKKAGVKLIAYTSILRADTSGLGLAAEHKATEEMIRGSKIPFVFLRNGWYLENYTENLKSALAHGVIPGSAGTGRIAAAARADYAGAAVEAVTGKGHEGKIYELGGDAPYTMAELAAEVSKQSGKAVKYNDLPYAEYKTMLLGFGLPPPVAELFANSDVGISKGELTTDRRDLSQLIGHPTTSLAAAVAAGLKLA